MHCYIEGLSHNGEGVARIEGKATFIPFAIPGETVDAEITEVRKTYSRARLLEIVQASADRTEPLCPYYYQCGGCAYQHVSYPRQLQMKRQLVKDTLERIGGIGAGVNPVLGMEHPWRYRNKVEWHAGQVGGRVAMGYYRSGSRDLIRIQTCLLISQEMEDISAYIGNNLENLRVPRDGTITVRQSSASGEMMIIFGGEGSDGVDFARLLNHRELASVYSTIGHRTRLHYGDNALTERLADIDFEVSPLAFFQVNHQQNQKLVDSVIRYSQLRDDYAVLDAYCGTGTIALNIAAHVSKVVGVENDRGAIKDAKRNAFKNSLANCRFIRGACEVVVPDMHEYFDVVILDPPRSGCRRELLDAVLKISPRRLIYVSCNPATLARDLSWLTNSTYRIEAVQPIDMFPQTSHVETVVLLERKHTTK